MQVITEPVCPVCANALIPSGRKYFLEELFDLWKPVEFTSETIAEHKRQSEYTQLYICPACKLEIFLPQIIGSSGFYVDLLRHQNVYAYSHEKWDFVEALKDAIGCSTAIEIGCGPGNFLEQLALIVKNIYGTEYNEHALGVARSKGFEVHGIDDKQEDKLRGKCDIAFSFHVLEHVPDPVQFIQEMFSWVGDVGKIGLSVPDMDGPVKFINPCVSNMPPHHATRWKLKTFEVLAEKYGYKIDRVAYEPLVLKQHSYYSTFWVGEIFPGDTLIMRATRFIVMRFLLVFFKVSTLLGIEYISWLRGQSIYVLLSKNK